MDPYEAWAERSDKFWRKRAIQMGQPQALYDIMKERERQDKKWGVRNLHPLRWLAILVEEVGELATATLDPKDGGSGDMRLEAIQVAAVAIAFVDCLDRDMWEWDVDGSDRNREGET